MPKLSLSDITSGYNSTSRINAAWAALEAALENTLSRDGTTPNGMNAVLDMNSNRIINLPSPTSGSDAARWSDVIGALSISTPVPSQTGQANKYLKTDGSVLGWDFPTGYIARTAAEITAGITPTYYHYPEGHVLRYGADRTGAIASDTAINAAVAVMSACGGGWVVNAPGGVLRVTTTIEIPSGVKLELNGGRLKQYTSNIAIIRIGTNAQQWQVQNGYLEYDVQQTVSNTNALALQLAAASSTTYLGVIRNVSTFKAYRGFAVPNLSGCFSFLVEFSGCLAYESSDYGWYIQGDTATGGCTNIRLDNCWVAQPSGAEQSTSKGFAFRGVSQLTFGSIAVDHIQQQHALWLENCTGGGTAFVAESCDFAASSGQNATVLVDGGSFSIDYIGGEVNNFALTGTADWAMVRTGSNTMLTIHSVRDTNANVNDGGSPPGPETSSGAYYAGYASGTGSRVFIRSYITAGSTPPAILADFVVPAQIEYFNGTDRLVLTGSKVYDPASLAAGAWRFSETVTVTGAAVGDYVESVSFSVPNASYEWSGSVTAANTVTVIEKNGSGSPIDLGSGTLRVRVRKA